MIKSFNNKEIEAGQYFIMATKSYGNSHIRTGKIISIEDVKSKYGYTYTKIKVAMPTTGIDVIYDTPNGKYQRNAQFKERKHYTKCRICMVHRYGKMIIIPEQYFAEIFSPQFKECLDNPKNKIYD